MDGCEVGPARLGIHQTSVSTTGFLQATASTSAGEAALVTSAHSPIRFEVVPGVVALHEGALVVIEQRPARDHVCVRDLATGERSRVSVSSLRGREVERLSDLLDTHEDRLRDVGEEELEQAKVREAVVQGLITSPGRMRQRIAVAATSLRVSPRQVHR